MQWAFSFFITGLAIVTFVQGILQWGTTLLQYSSLMVRWGEIIVMSGVVSAIAMVVSAFYLLLVSVCRFPVDADAIQMSGSPKVPVIIASTVRIYICPLPLNLPSNVIHSGDQCQSWRNTNNLRIVCCERRLQIFIFEELS